MACRPPTDAELRGLLRRAYGVADSDALVELGGLSGRNVQFRSRGRLWVLKQYRRRGLADLPRLDAVYDALETESFPTPLPRRTVTGSRFSRRAAAMFAVLPWCAGGVRHQGGFSRAGARQAAGLLRRLHGVPLPGPLADAAPPAGPRGGEGATFHAAAEALRRRLRKEHAGLLGDAVDRSLAAKERFLVTDRHLCSSPPGRPSVLVHGDAHNENFLFDDEDDVVALLDFEDCQVADPSSMPARRHVMPRWRDAFFAPTTGEEYATPRACGPPWAASHAPWPARYFSRRSAWRVATQT